MTDRNETLDRLIEAARLLGITQAKKGYGIYTIADGKCEGALYESIGALHRILTQPEIPMSPEHLPQYIATNNIKPTTEGGGGAGGAQPEQDISYTDIQMAELIMSDCGHSSDYTLLLNRIAGRLSAYRQALAQPEQVAIKQGWDVDTLLSKPKQEPEIVRRVRRYAGKRRESVSSPHITAKECIALANWIESMLAQPEPVVSFTDNHKGLCIQLVCNGAYYWQNLSDFDAAKFFVDAYRGKK